MVSSAGDAHRTGPANVVASDVAVGQTQVMQIEPTTDPIEQCDECCFDSRQWNRQDSINTIRHFGDFAAMSIASAENSIVGQRPDPAMWSIGEYIDHMGNSVQLLRTGVEVARDAPGFDVGEIEDCPFGDHVNIDAAEALVRLRTESALMLDTLRKLTDEQWSNGIVASGDTLSVDWMARHIIYDCFHHLADIANIGHRLGGTIELTGSIGRICAPD
jgi:hypothetical protein